MVLNLECYIISSNLSSLVFLNIIDHVEVKLPEIQILKLEQSHVR